jgi:hypothetical protein
VRQTVLCIALPATIVGSVALILGMFLSSVPAPTTLPGPATTVLRVGVGPCVEAPTAAFGAPGVAGHATVCDDGTGLQLAAQISGLSPGDEYAAWLGYASLPATCYLTPCRATDQNDSDSTASMLRIAAASVEPSGALALAGTLPDARLLHGSRLVLQVLGERGRAGPYVHAIFVVP